MTPGCRKLKILGCLLLAGLAAPPLIADTYNGADLYQLNCANCHGTFGEGDGAVTPDLSVVLLDLRYLSARNDGAFPQEFVVSIIDGRETRAAHGPACAVRPRPCSRGTVSEISSAVS